MSNYPRLDKTGLTRAINGIASKVFELIPGVFSRTENGLVPKAPSGSGTSKYLREDGTWNEPPSGSGGVISYGTCTTAAATAAKVVTLSDASGWELKQGASVAVKFSNTNTFSATAQDPVTLNVNNTGAKNIYYGGSANPTGTNTTAFGRANYVNTYVYDGTYWVWVGSSSDNNTTYSAMSVSELTTGTATSQRTVRADYLKQGIEQIAESGDIDTANNTATFTSSDTTDASATSWTSVTKLASGESHKSIFAKMSQMFKNVRYLYKMLGTTDISSIGDGTVTGGLDTLKDAINNVETFSLESGQIQAAKVGRIVTLQVNWSTSITRSTAGYYTLANLPSELRPILGFVFLALNNDASSTAKTPLFCNIGMDGKINLFVYSDNMSFTPRFTVTYIS